jgi:hypothetical protein
VLLESDFISIASDASSEIQSDLPPLGIEQAALRPDQSGTPVLTKRRNHGTDDEIRVPTIPVCLRRAPPAMKAAIAESRPAPANLSMSSTTHHEFESVPVQTHDDEELKIQDLSESVIDAIESKQRKLTFTPIIVQKNVQPSTLQPQKDAASQDRAHVSFGPTKPPPQASSRVASMRFPSSSYSFLAGRPGSNPDELVDQNYLNALQSARVQLEHIRQSVGSARRLRTLRESAQGSFQYTSYVPSENPFA